MTLVAGWTGRNPRRHPLWLQGLWRFALSLRPGQRAMTRHRSIRRGLAGTQDSEVFAEVGIRAGRPSHLERWLMAMLWHQR